MASYYKISGSNIAGQYIVKLLLYIIDEQKCKKMTHHKTRTVLLKCGFATDCAMNSHSLSDVYGM